MTVPVKINISGTWLSAVRRQLYQHLHNTQLILTLYLILLLVFVICLAIPIISHGVLFVRLLTHRIINRDR